MTKGSIQFIIVCIVLLTASVAVGETLRIVTLSLPPYGYVEKGTDTGLNYELSNLLAVEAGFEPDNRIIPLIRAVDDIAAGRADMVIMFPNPTIDAVAKNLGIILPMETVLFGRAGSLYRSLKDARGKIVASVRGARYDERISKKSGIILYPTASYSQSLKMLLAGRVEAVIGPKLGLYFTVKTDNYPKRAFGDPLVLSTAQGCVFISNKTSPDIIEKVVAAMTRILANGTVHMLLEKYSL